MSFRSADQIEKQTSTEPLISGGLLQCKSSFDKQTFEGGKHADRSSPEQAFNSTSIGMSAAPGFGHDFSLIPTHSDMVRQAMPSLSTGTMVQRFPEPTTEETPPAPEATPMPTSTEPEEESAAPEETTAPALLVEDSAAELAPGQMRKGEFLAQLRAEVTRAAESAMAGTGRTTADCPYLDYWFDYYSAQDVQHGERALRRYAPEASIATTAREYIPIIASRVRRSVETWVRTGEVTGMPEGLPGMGLLGSIGSLISGIGSIFFKARSGGARKPNDPRAIQSQLGSGRSLDSGVRSRMESAFGMDFSHVRTHTDTTAAGMSDRLNARAFTVGEHVAFGSGEYKPGTILGDALIAHEMAHVVQQKGAGSSVASMQTGDTGYSMLENDADKSAAGALASLWSGAKGKLVNIAQSAMPRLRSGLSLQRCDVETCSEGEKNVSVDLVKLHDSTRTPATDLAVANRIFKTGCVKFTGNSPSPASKTLTETWLGGDTDLDVTGITCSNVPTEEKAMYDGATSEYKLSSRIRAFYVQTFSGYAAGRGGFSRNPDCATGSAAPYANHTVLGNNAADMCLAHEFGHILLNTTGHSSVTGNLMHEDGGYVLNDTQRKTIYNNA